MANTHLIERSENHQTMSKKLSNITVKEFRELLTQLGLQPLRTAGENREIIIQQWHTFFGK